MASISLPSSSQSSSSSPSIPCSSSSSSYSPSLLLLHRRNAPHHQPRRSRRRSSVSTSRFRIVGPIPAVDGATSVLDPSQDFSELLVSLKLKLLSSVSGLNRGLAATEEDIRTADDAAKELEAVVGPVDLSVNIDKLQGKWKLIYSSAFSSRTLGGSRPGPPTGRLLPITLGQVFQRIDTVSKDFDNIVELELGAPWPFPPVEVTATLAHKFELIGTSLVRIKFEKTTVKAYGNLSQLPPLEIPRIPDALRPPSNTGSGEFEVTYIDSDTRITRGDRDELRVFVIA